jgi:hypothetical protein
VDINCAPLSHRNVGSPAALAKFHPLSRVLRG